MIKFEKKIVKIKEDNTADNKTFKKKHIFRSMKELRKYLNKLNSWSRKVVDTSFELIDKHVADAANILTSIFIITLFAIAIFGYSPITLAFANILFIVTTIVDLLYVSRGAYFFIKAVIKVAKTMKNIKTVKNEI